MQWEVAGTLSLSDVLTALFLLAFAISRLDRLDARLARCSAVALLFFVAFALVYLLGFFNLETGQALAQWAKGMVKFVLHFLFLVAGVSLVVRRAASGSTGGRSRPSAAGSCSTPPTASSSWPSRS